MSANKDSSFFTTKLTSAEILKLRNKLETKVVKNKTCKLWSGTQRNGYGILEFRFRGKKIKIPVHRLAYYLHNNCHQLSPDIHVSHLCHDKLCCNVEHLSYEPQRINNKRQTCKSNGECSGHHGFQNCIF